MDMDIDVEPSHTSVSPPTQQPPPDSPTRPCDTQNQSLLSASSLTTATPPSTAGFGSLTLSFRPIQAIPSATLAPPISNTVETTKSSDFLSLPKELKARTLSFVSAREVASNCRAVCSELRDFIDRHEDHIAQLGIMRNRAGLQYRINDLTHMNLVKPQNIATFVSYFRYWVAQRGLARYLGNSAYRPFIDWVIGHEEGEQRKSTNRWRRNTRFLVKLQRRILCHPASSHAYLLDLAIGDVKTIEVGYAQYKSFCEQIARRGVSQPFFNFKSVEDRKREEHETYPAFRLTNVSLEARRGSLVLNPFSSPEFVAQLALPSLPGARFCYHVEEEWCRNGLDTGAMLSPLAKAAFLEVVKIF